MKLYVVRHGQTNYNVEGLNNSDPTVDVHLTDEGILQAREVAEKLGDVDWDVVYVSELPRTHQTAKYINRNGASVLVDSRLNDIRSGFDDRTVEEYHSVRNYSEDPFTYRFGDNFESSEDVYRRTQAFLDDLRDARYKKVLVVTSAHNFRHFKGIIDGLEPRDILHQKISNAEILIRDL